MSRLRSPLIVAIGLAIGSFVVPAAPALATTVRTVSDCSTDTGLRDAITDLDGGSGGAIEFACGTATIPLSADLPKITQPIGVDGEGTITIDGGHAYRPFNVASGVQLQLSGLTLTNAYKGSDNDDVTTAKGAAIRNAGTLTLTNVNITHSYTAFAGGAISTSGPVDITGGTFAFNNSSYGGAIHAETGLAVLTIRGAVFHDDAVNGPSSDAGTGRGGALYLTNAAAATVRGSTFYGNEAFRGGAIAIGGAAASVTIVNSSLHDNMTDGGANTGGGVWNEGTVTLTHVNLAGNTSQDGGAIENEGTANVTDSTFSGNKAVTANGSGGGFTNRYGGQATIDDSTFVGNSAVNVAGGFVNASSTATLTNVTFSGNSSDGAFSAVEAFESTLHLVNVTIANNTSPGPAFGAIAFSQSHVTVENVILAHNNGGNCEFDPAPDTNTTNMSSDGTCNFGQGRDNQPGHLGPLADNGGLTRTLLPLPGSPALDRGTSTGAPPRDQRGVLRPQGAAYDVGAVERVPTTVQDVSMTVSYDGWSGESNPKASGGAFRIATAAKERATYAFTGHSVSVITRQGPSDGKMVISVDGAKKCSCDLYAPAPHWHFAITLTGLSDGNHVLIIEVKGKRNPHSSGTNVVLDAIVTVDGTAQETDLNIAYGGWHGALMADASGGTFHVSGSATDVARLRFVGTEIGLVTATGPNRGIAQILVDGVVKKTVDLYAALPAWRQFVAVDGLSDGPHTLVVHPSGTHDAASHGNTIVIDAFTGYIVALH